MSVIICHCFGHTLADLEDDIRLNGESTIMRAIVTARGEGACRCATLNPSGR